MLNRTPSNTSNVISSYRKRRQQRGPMLVYGAIALVVIGIIVILVWLFGSGQNPIGEMFPTETLTPTLTFTPTNTNTPIPTSTITETPTITLTATPSAPFPYTVQEGEFLSTIAEKFTLGDNGIALIVFLNPFTSEAADFSINRANQNVYPNQKIMIPNPGMQLPTATPFPANLSRGTRIEYTVETGDTLAGIAAKFNSIAEDIITINNLENPNDLKIGQVLKVPVNLVTATPTLPPSSTPITPTVEGQTPIPPAATSGNTPTTSSACEPLENPAYVTELQNLINTARSSNGLVSLSVNAQLTAAAKKHAIDLICTNTFSHKGSDDSTPQTRLQAQGFTASLVIENLYALSPVYGGNAQSAFNWWNSDPASKADLLNPNTTVIGIAYVSYEKSLFGGYFVVVMAKP